MFGTIENDAMVLNGHGEIVREEWLKSSEIRSEIRLGEYTIMPNHFHAIVYIVDHRNNCRGDRLVAHTPIAHQTKGDQHLKAKKVSPSRRTPKKRDA